jgi:hypothetical protein
MPDTVSGSHPLDASGRQHTGLAGRFRVADRPVEHHRHRGDARVRVPAELHRYWQSSPIEVEKVEEHEGLDELAEAGGAHQPGDGSMRASVRAVHDFANGLLNLTCQHDLLLPACAQEPVRRRIALGSS